MKKALKDTAEFVALGIIIGSIFELPFVLPSIIQGEGAIGKFLSSVQTRMIAAIPDSWVTPYSNDRSGVKEFVDPETGVHYFVTYQDYQTSGITPRYDSQGNIMISETGD